MEPNNGNIPWLDGMEAELDNRVVQYLINNNAEYRGLQNQVIALLDETPAIKELLDGCKELQLSEQEHRMYQEYRRLRTERDALERKYLYLAGQADMKPYVQTLQGLRQKGTADGTYKIDHLHLEFWQMEIINHAVEEAEKAARRNCKEYGEIEKRISGLYNKYPFIDSFTDKSKRKEGGTFSKEELQKVSECLALEDDKRYIEQTELYLKGIRDGYALKKFLESE